MRRLTFLLFLQLFALFSPPSLAQTREIQCKVVGISDGDTLTCLQNRKPLKVRLQYIDAPESAQAYGKRAKQALSTLAFKKQVRVQVTGYDKYHRLLGVVFDEANRNLNLLLVEQGMAWAYRQTQPIYQQAEALARAARKGLWQDPNPQDPADFRRQKQDNPATDNLWGSLFGSPNKTRQPSACQPVRHCRDFQDYEAALHYFQQCGSKTMDGNRDGIPCNNLYRKRAK